MILCLAAAHASIFNTPRPDLKLEAFFYVICKFVNKWVQGSVCSGSILTYLQTSFAKDLCKHS